VGTATQLVERLGTVYADVPVQRTRKQPLTRLNDLGHSSRVGYRTTVDLPVVSPIDPDLGTSVSETYSQAAETFDIE
jgi:hypothetical protein